MNEFNWDSEDQKKGYLGLKQWLNSKKLGDEKIRATDLFFIQKDHESAVWFAELIGEHIKRLENEIMRLKKEVAELRVQK